MSHIKYLTLISGGEKDGGGFAGEMTGQAGDHSS